jgi:tRNA modification GTPase
MEDTIVAISTPVGEGAIAIVRMSGSKALAIADRLFESRQGRPSDFHTHTVHFGRVGINGNSVDQVMLTVMRAPRTYTAEDVVEINCHGGQLTTRRILQLCLENGARLAEPGEFTRRAFLNGKMDLTQAEAVMDLIAAKSELAHTAAENALEGHLSKQIFHARDRLIRTLAHIEAHIDFPEEDIDVGTRDQWLAETGEVLSLLEQLLATVHDGKVLREGISIAIVGRPNVGKSSLMNALLGEERSIVTAVPGTTRDTLEETANIQGIPVRLIDTAGIRRARGIVEAIGIDRSRITLARSDIVIHVMDGSRRLSSLEHQIGELYRGRKAIQVINKIDLPQRLYLKSQFSCGRQVSISTITGQGLEDLKRIIVSETLTGTNVPLDTLVVVNQRQGERLRSALRHLKGAEAELQEFAPAEIVSRSLRLGLDALGEIVGSTATEDILASIFSSFCIGK